MPTDNTIDDVALLAREYLPQEDKRLSKAIVLMFAFACGVTTANVYYAQSIAGAIADSLGVPSALSGLIVTTTQFGYGIGLFFLVCLADLIENRRLVLITTAGTVLSLIGVASSTSPFGFFVASSALGVCTVGSQILVPLAVHLTSEKQRGRVIGIIMAGLVTGIMLSRPLASFLAAQWGWRPVFILSAVVMSGTFCLLAKALPRWQPTQRRSYAATLGSTLRLLATSRPLQRRAAYQGSLFAVFNLFWTAVPLELHDRFGMTQTGIAAFAFAGAAGALSAPLAGRVADSGKSTIGTGVVMLLAAVALLISGWGQSLGAVLIMVAAAIILDAATQANQVFGQRVIQSLDAGSRGRLNSGYMTVIFFCGAVGSSLASLSFYHGGWWLTVAIGGLVIAGIFCVFLTEYPRSRR